MKIFAHKYLCIKLQKRRCQITFQTNVRRTTAFGVCSVVELRPEERNRLTGCEKGWEGFLSVADKKNTNPDVKGAVMEALIRGVFVWRETAWGLHFQEGAPGTHSLLLVFGSDFGARWHKDFVCLLLFHLCFPIMITILPLNKLKF